jgi:hypothetical protein
MHITKIKKKITEIGRIKNIPSKAKNRETGTDEIFVS